MGFHAVGSGSAAAQVARALLGHYEPLGRSVPHLRLIAYRAVSTCIDVLGGRYGVGGKVQMWEAQGNDAEFRQLDDAELASVDNGVQQWTTIEAESLDQVVLEPAPEGEAAGAPEGVEMPEVLDPETPKTPKK